MGLERQGLTAAALAAGLADPVATATVVFGSDFDKSATTDWATRNACQLHDDRVLANRRWLGAWSDSGIHSNAVSRRFLGSFSSVDSSKVA
jgi:hypothetical protein